MTLRKIRSGLAGVVSVAALVAIVNVPAAQAGINSWTLNGPGGGPTDSVAIHPTTASIVLVSAGNGLYRSADGGSTWTHVGDAAGVDDLVFDPMNANRVFAVGGGRAGLWRSDDAGASFALSPQPANSVPYRIAIANDGTMYLADRSGRVYRSTNVGLDWNEVGRGWSLSANEDTVSALAVDPANANILIAAIKNLGASRSTDGGATWSPILANSPGSGAQNQPTRIVFKPGDSSRVIGTSRHGRYLSNDGGATWTQQVAGQWFDVAFDRTAPDNVIALSFGQIERSTDGGATWPSGNRGAVLHAAWTPGIAVGPGGKVVVASSDGPLVSDDAGDSFTLEVAGLHSEGVREFATAGDGTIYAALSPGPFGVYRRNAAAWQPVDNVEMRANLDLYPYVVHIAVAPSDADRLYAVGVLDTLLRSADGGQTWSAPHPAFAYLNMTIRSVTFDPQNPTVAYVLTESAGLWRTGNDGATFVQHSAGIPGGAYAFAIDPANPQIMYMGDFAGLVYRSVDGGLTWNPGGSAPGGYLREFRFDPMDSRIVYAVQNTGISKSVDGGASWIALSLGSNQAVVHPFSLSIDPSNPASMIVGGISEGYGFMRSVDGGLTWQSTRWQAVHVTMGAAEIYAVDHASGTVSTGGYGTGLHEYQIATDLAVELPPALTAGLGANGTLDVTIRNLGPFHAANPRLDIVVPSNLSVVVPAGCTYLAPNLRCEPGSVRSGETRRLTLAYIAGAAAANGSLSATVTAREHDTAVANNTGAVAVGVAPVADLRVSVTATASAVLNGAVTFTATLRNDGPNDAAATSYSLAVPSGVTLQSTTPSVGTCGAASAGTISCALGTLASGASATVTVQGTAAATGVASWSGTLSSAATDPLMANNAASTATTVTAPPAAGGASGGGKGGGGALDWLGLLLLGLLSAVRREKGRTC